MVHHEVQNDVGNSKQITHGVLNWSTAKKGIEHHKSKMYKNDKVIRLKRGTRKQSCVMGFTLV